MQAGLLEVFEQDAALGLDDGFGQAGGAGGVQDPQRVAEGDLFEDRFGVVRGQVRPVHGAFGGGGAEQRDVDDGAQGGQFVAELGDGVAAVVFLAAVVVTVDGEQHDRFDLLEAVQHAAGAEVGGAGGPYGADRGGGEECDDGLRDVGDVGADAVAGADAEAAEFGGQRADLGAQIRPGDGGGLMGLVDVQQCGRIGAGRVLGGAQGVLGVVEGGAGEPAGAGHRAVGEDGLVRGGEADVEPLGGGLPEGGEVADGPVMQVGVAPRGVAGGGGGCAVVCGRPGVEAGDLCAGDAVRAWLPERFRLVGGLRCGGHHAAPGRYAWWASGTHSDGGPPAQWVGVCA